MADIFDNTTNFDILDSVDDFDKTTLEEQRIQCELLGFYNEHLISQKIYLIILPVGSQRPRLYGLPKKYPIKINFINGRLCPTPNCQVVDRHTRTRSTNTFST